MAHLISISAWTHDDSDNVDVVAKGNRLEIQQLLVELLIDNLKGIEAPTNVVAANFCEIVWMIRDAVANKYGDEFYNFIERAFYEDSVTAIIGEDIDPSEFGEPLSELEEKEFWANVLAEEYRRHLS